jgi:hypothetical protein
LDDLLSLSLSLVTKILEAQCWQKI